MISKIMLVFLLIINCWVSLLVSRRDDLEIKQKLYQIIFIWILPVIGAFGLFFFYKTQDSKAELFAREFGGGTSEGIGGSSGGNDG
ncbi:MAG: hypothetical protein ACRBEE_11785 [Arenicella sp.]